MRVIRRFRETQGAPSEITYYAVKRGRKFMLEQLLPRLGRTGRAVPPHGGWAHCGGLRERDPSGFNGGIPQRPRTGGETLPFHRWAPTDHIMHHPLGQRSFELRSRSVVQSHPQTESHCIT